MAEVRDLSGNVPAGVAGADTSLPTALVGSARGARVTDPDAAAATVTALLRGVLYELQNLTLTTGDLEIGAVELKNATDDTRAIITAAGGVSAVLLAGVAEIGNVKNSGTFAVQQTQLAAATLTHAATALSTVSTTALAANTAAKYRALQNTDTAALVTIRAGTAAAVAGTGIVLQPGQMYEMSAIWNNLDTRAFTAIAHSGTPLLATTEA